MSILIVGDKGNMGARYRAVLDFLGKEVKGADIRHNQAEILELAKESEGVIIATPTETHLSLIELLSQTNAPILCEKPLTKDPKKLDQLLMDVKPRLTMVYQYEELVDRMRAPNWTYYNYFKHGSDGLVWDCIQVIGLSKGEIALEDDSPIWKCVVNGQKLNLAHMDHAYIKFVRKWLMGQKQDLGWIRNTHYQTKEIEKVRSIGLPH